jgi:hypothetical protein
MSELYTQFMILATISMVCQHIEWLIIYCHHFFICNDNLINRNQMLLGLHYKLCLPDTMRGNALLQQIYLCFKWYYYHNITTVAITFDLLQWIKLCGKRYYCNNIVVEAITKGVSQWLKLCGKWFYCDDMITVVITYHL